MSTLDAWCPTADCYMSLGDGPASGISLTTSGGNVFTYAEVNTNIDSNASLWLQSNADGGVVCKSGVTIGTPVGIKVAAGEKIDIWAGAATTPNLGGPNGPAGAPTAPKEPCGGTEASVNASNALNGAVKGASDIASGVMGVANAEGALDAVASGWDAAKGAWDIAKSGQDAGAYTMNESAVKGIDGAIGMVDQGLAVAKGEVPNVVGFMNSGSALASAVAGSQGADGSGGGAGSGAGGHGGAAKIEARGPAGIKKLTDNNMEAFVGKKIEYKAGTNIVMNAANKVETCSMVFEAHANIAATMKGLARAKVESLGKVVIDGLCKFKVETKGTGTIEAGPQLDIKSKVLMNITAGGMIVMKGDASVNIESAGGITLESPAEVDITTPKTTLSGELVVAKTTEIKGPFKARSNMLVEKASRFRSTVRVDGNLNAKDVCKFG